MITTRNRINEQVQLLYSQFLKKNGYNDNIDVRLIDIFVNQSINKFIKVQVLSNFKAGDIEIPSVNMMEYTLTPSQNKVTLPVYPVNIKFDMGVWSIAPASSPFSYYIPVPNIFQQTFAGTATEFLEGQTGWYQKGLTINFTKTVTTPVVVTLLVSDYGATGLTDPLPLSPELQSDIISDVMEQLNNARFTSQELQNKDNNAN
jgi:hypothetical protein